jgi:hypothetical protein
MRDVLTRLCHAASNHVEGNKYADRQQAVHDQVRAIPERRRIDDLPNQIDALVSVLRQGLRTKCCGYIGGELLIPTTSHCGSRALALTVWMPVIGGSATPAKRAPNAKLIALLAKHTSGPID